MTMTDNLIAAESGNAPVLSEETIPVVSSPNILADLEDVVFKLRAFMESREGDIGLGIELGMQRAADMIENVINRHVQQGE